MMKNMKKLVIFIFGIAAIVALSCTKADPSQTKFNIVVKSDFSKSASLGITPKSGTTGQDEIKSATLTASAFTLETFLINIEDIEFKLDDDLGNDDVIKDDCNDDCNDDCEDGKGIVDEDDNDGDEFEIKGPILINLLSNEIGHGLVVATSELPNGVYEEVEIELDKYTKDPENKIYNHTILIEGQIDGKKLEIWYNGDYDFEIDFPDFGTKYCSFRRRY